MILIKVKGQKELFTCWKIFLSTELANVLVPDWKTKMQAVDTYLKPFDDEKFK